MKTKLRKIGNSKGLIIPKTLIEKYNLDQVIIEDTENGILIKPGKPMSLFEEKLKEARANKDAVYSNMKNAVSTMLEEEKVAYEKEVEELNDFDIEEE